jgi:hypothetical protein
MTSVSIVIDEIVQTGTSGADPYTNVSYAPPGTYERPGGGSTNDGATRPEGPRRVIDGRVRWTPTPASPSPESEL